MTPPGTAPAFGDSIAGCLLGGAVGDALGAVVEFDAIDVIRRRHGADGLVALPPEGGRITDDTQMALFTAEEASGDGVSERRGRARGGHEWRG